MAAPVSALEICIHKLKSDFIHSGAAQQYLPANVAHSHIDVHIRIRSDAQHVFLCAHAATEAYLAYCKRGLTPGTGDCRRNGFFQHDPFVTPLPSPWTSWSRIQRATRQLPRLKTAIRHDLGGIAGNHLIQRLSARSSSNLGTSSRLSSPMDETACLCAPLCSISRRYSLAAGPNPCTSSTMRSHSSRRIERKKRSARCSVAACEFRRNTSSRSVETFCWRKASSMKSGRRVSNPIRGRSSFSSAGRRLATYSIASHACATARYCLRWLASVLSRTKAAPNNGSISGSDSLAIASPSACALSPSTVPPTVAYRSAS